MQSPAFYDTRYPVDPPTRGEIDGVNVRIYYASRSWAFLFLVLVATLALAVALARHFGKVIPANAEAETPRALQLLNEPRPDFRAIIAALWQAPSIPGAKLESAVQRSDFSAGTQSVVGAFAASLREGVNEPTAELLILAHQTNPEPGANECVAELATSRGGFG